MRHHGLLPAVILLVACAPPSALLRSPPPGPTEVRLGFAPDQADAVFARAIEVLESRGFHFDVCDDGHSVLRTDRAEVDAPCYGTSCLARQRVVLKVGWRRLALTLRREVWDAACRDWVEITDPASRLDVAREEQLLVRALLEADLGAIARSRLSAALPAACSVAAVCGPGGCELDAALEADPGRIAVPVATR